MLKRILLAPILCLMLLGVPTISFTAQAQPAPVYVLQAKDLDGSLRKAKNGTPEGKGFYLVDVRTPEEHIGGIIPGTDININHTDIAKRHTEIGAKKDDHIVMYCQSGQRSNMAAEVLVSLGYQYVYNLQGSMNAWRASGFPVISPEVGQFNNANPGQPPKGQPPILVPKGR